MGFRILNYQATQPQSSVDIITAIGIPQSPSNVKLAQLFLVIPDESDKNTVELMVTVGVQGVLNISQIFFRIFRGNVEIFNTQQGVESTGSEQTYTIAFQGIEFNVEEGSHVYKVTAENITPNSDAIVVGPISFSALAINAK